MSKFRSQMSAGDAQAVPSRIKSPCISVCALNQEDICTGCYRTGHEIAQWGSMSQSKQREVLRASQQRAKVFNPFLS